MDQTELFLRFGVAIAIGFMIGLQREFALRDKTRDVVAGERTFALLALVGALAAFVADELASPLVFLGIVLLLGVFTAVAYFVEAWRGHVGLTTEAAMLVTILIGALSYWGFLVIAVAIGIATTALLSLKVETDRFVRVLTREDIFVALQFAVISAIVLPVLPNQSFLPEPFDVLNPFKIWLMVVFISGISFLGYVALKFMGAEQGISLIGFLGGLVSSTAVTLSFTERSTNQPKLSKPFALAILIAWTVMFSRVLIEVGVLNRALLGRVWLPLVAAALAGLLYGLYLFFSQRADDKVEVEFSNPFNLGTAIKFGLLYGLVLLIARTAQIYTGGAGILLSSILAGTVDVDAITLSIAELVNAGGLDLDTASQAIVFAAISNTLVKGAITIFTGSVLLRKAIWPGVVLMAGVALGALFLI